MFIFLFFFLGLRRVSVKSDKQKWQNGFGKHTKQSLRKLLLLISNLRWRKHKIFLFCYFSASGFRYVSNTSWRWSCQTRPSGTFYIITHELHNVICVTIIIILFPRDKLFGTLIETSPPEIRDTSSKQLGKLWLVCILYYV